MLRIKKISEVIGKHVYTSEGDYFGQVEEVSLVDNKIEGWRIKIGPGLMGVLGGARGVIIPHQFVKAIGDVFIINKASLPARGDEMPMPAEGVAAEEMM
ncbi:MAG TPA: PRC-barrel domain-containing protein [Candidatus Nanoarchaeia archaeon]|nr:PRC-barrel domain-containing protein [Candidatus Nanoarchaeia archaeon]